MPRWNTDDPAFDTLQFADAGFLFLYKVVFIYLQKLLIDKWHNGEKQKMFSGDGYVSMVILG